MADYQVKLSSKKFKATVERTIVAENLSDLADVSVTNLPTKNKYVLAYDAGLQKYVLVSPDDVLSNSAEDGLPEDLLAQLDADLDNRIDVDAGTF